MAAPDKGNELTPDIVRMAYRLLLGREPENEAVVTGALSYRSVSALRAAFLDSSEFRAGLPPRTDLVPIHAPPSEIEWEIGDAAAGRLLDHVRRTWTRLGQERPHWSVLSDDAFMPERIERNRTHFFESGRADLRDIRAILARIGMTPSDLPRAFEFGCGVGRVTPFLAEAFRHVTAADVSSSHLALARERAAGHGNIRFELVEDARFGMTEAFDFWFSRIVLQHNPPPIIAMILTRALHLLAPGGVAIFQVPTYAMDYRFRLQEYLDGLTASGGIEMHVIPQPVVFGIMERAGCRPVEVLADTAAGNPGSWRSNTFVVRKQAAAAG